MQNDCALNDLNKNISCLISFEKLARLNRYNMEVLINFCWG